MRKRRLPLLWKAVRGFFPPALAGKSEDLRPAPWFDLDFVRRNRSALSGYPSRVALFGPLPSFQDNLDKLDTERRLQAYFGLWSEILRDVRCPYHDRDFLEFMYAIPREQIVGVGQRRFLMKRALVGIVPGELLERKRKPLPPPKDCSTQWPSSSEIGQHVISGSIGIIEPNRLLEELHKARCNEEVSIDNLRRTLTLEAWLRHLTMQGILTNPMPTKEPHHSQAFAQNEPQMTTHQKVQLASCVRERH